MKTSNISLGNNIVIDPTSSINNVVIGDNVKIAKYCSIYGSEENILEIGVSSIISMFTILNGFAGKLKIGKNVSIGHNSNIMCDTGPTASKLMLQFYPVIKGDIIIEDHVWIGAGVVIMPNVTIGRCSIIAANSFVSSNVEAYHLYGGNPAKKLKFLKDIKEYEDRPL